MNGKNPKRNNQVIIISLLLAFILWFMVKMSKNYDYTIDIPLKIVNTNPDLCLKYPLPSHVRVVFLGKGTDLLRMKFYDIKYVVDLSEVKNQLVLNLSEHPEFVQFSEELAISVKSILRPQQIVFDFDQCESKKVPVVVKAQVETAPGHILVQMSSGPDSIEIKGPKTFVDTLSRVVTEKKVFKEVNLPFREKFKIIESSQFHVNYIPDEVEVTFDVQRLAEKYIDNVPVEVINVPADYNVVPLPSFVRVYLKGGEKILADAGKDDVKIIIDFKRDWRRGENKVKASIVTDLNILYAETNPSLFELIIQKRRNSF